MKALECELNICQEGFIFALLSREEQTTLEMSCLLQSDYRRLDQGVILRFSSTVWTVEGSPLPDLQASDPQLLKLLIAKSKMPALKNVEQHFKEVSLEPFIDIFLSA